MSAQNEPITISLRQTASLVSALATLKALHAIVFIFRVNPQTSPGKTVQRAIDRREHRIVDISLSIIPDTHYRRPKHQTDLSTATDGIQDLDRPVCACRSMELRQTNTEGQTISDVTSSCFHNPIIEVSSEISPALRLSQYLSTTDLPIELVTTYNTAGSAVDSMHVVLSESVYSPALRRSESVYSPTLRRSQSSSAPRQNVPVRASQYARLVADQPRWSRRSSLDYAELQLSNDSGMSDLQAVKSVESFPGMFPISDGLEFSSLATAPPKLRGRETTRVRPFSDM